MTPGARQRLGIAFALIAAAGYAINAVAAQIAAQAGLSGPLMVLWRVLLMLPIVLAALALTRGSLAVPAAERPALIVFGLASSVVGLSYLSAVSLLPVSVAAVVFYLFPVLIVLAEPVVEGHRFGWRAPLIALVAFAGIALVVGPRLEGLSGTGLMLALMAALGATVQFFAATRMPGTGTAAKLFWTHLIVLPGALATLSLIGGLLPPQAALLAPWAVAITVGSYLGAIALQVMALERAPAGLTGLAFTAEPLFAVALGVILLGESISTVQGIGALLVIGAIIAVTRGS
jgi:drug/metabolite transporter (DMT)-like permease